MDSNTISPHGHFHIKWDGFVRLDWECFSTREVATARAEELARPNEEFVIVEVSEKCPPGGPKRFVA